MENLTTARLMVRYAREAGLDVCEYLDARALLLTPTRTRQLRVQVLEELQRSMDKWEAHEYLRRINRDGPWTPQQMLEAVRLFMSEYISAEIEGAL